MENRKYSEAARVFCEAVQALGADRDSLANLESYLSMHFGEWLEKYANTPEWIAAEMREFSRVGAES